MTISGEQISQILLPRKLFRSYSSRTYDWKVELMDYQAFENVREQGRSRIYLGDKFEYKITRVTS